MYMLIGQWCLTTSGAKVVVNMVGLLGLEFAKLYHSKNATELHEQCGYMWMVICDQNT